ncbi:MAG: hypothetical protein U1E93_08600 [Alphaproteobacteria bacterium]
MILAAATLAVLLMVATGLVLLHRLARFLLRDEAIAGQEFLLIGILPGLALTGLVVTVLGLVHLLYGWALLLAAAAIFSLLWRDTRAVATALRESLQAIWASARSRDVFPLLALLAGTAALSLGIHISLLPSGIEDVWSYHLPIVHSFIAHHGIIAQQVPHPFYGNNPLLFELLFAVPMLAVDHFAGAGIVNVAIYFGLMLLILSFARAARGFWFLVLLAALVWASPFFLLGAASPMIDVPRSCFSAAAFLFAWRYAQDFRRFDLVMSALTAGTAVAGKYTELVTPLMICATLVPLMIPRRRTWMDMAPAAVGFAAISSFWYFKNAILYGNPIYPFLFAHPGLSDAWMADLVGSLQTSVHAEQQAYSRNLTSLRGWQDFASAWLVNFHRLLPMALLASLGLFLPRRRRWMLWLWTLLLFVIWYAVFFNGRRWAITATLLLFAAAFIAGFWILERVLKAWPQRARWLTPALGGAMALALLLAAITGRLLPRWVDGDLASTLGGGDAVAHQLAATRPGYALYRFIAGHNVSMVLMPSSPTAFQEVSAYNDGRDNSWILPHASGPITNTFLRQNGVRYFVVSRHAPGQIPEHLKSGAVLMLRDPTGFDLYRIDPTVLR